MLFNFRAVGESHGSHGNGVSKVKDLKTVVDFLAHCPGMDKNRIGVVGYSFGAMVAVNDLHLYKKSSAFAFISPPGRALDPHPTLRGDIPPLFVAGKEDGTATAQIIQGQLKYLNAGVRSRLISGTNNLWRGREVEVAQIVSQCVQEVLT